MITVIMALYFYLSGKAQIPGDWWLGFAIFDIIMLKIIFDNLGNIGKTVEKVE